ncbi:purine-cytosine permease family protein [Baaleninema sp.]|uniref:purine-cytosine permease family protein n=1 Tax=Baaleninema sp. TaxID=3101197 RepID=UPI003D06C58A
MVSPPRILKERREYNTWVANETLEDYSLRYAPKSFRKWPELLVANTALGGISFLALEAIGGSLAINYGFTNSFWAITVVGLIILLAGIPITYYAAKYNIDMDLLTRGAGFGYIGSTITSVIYASFTFIFFALEAAIMAQALELYFYLPLAWGYLLCSLIIIPMVFYGVTFINRLQLWTQPLWLVLMVSPYLFVLHKEPEAFSNWLNFAGNSPSGTAFDPLLFGAAATVSFSLIAQLGEQVDYLRFLPDREKHNRVRWWVAVMSAGPGWIVLGWAKQIGGAFLASLAIYHGVAFAKAKEPIQMYLAGFSDMFSDPAVVLAVGTLFVIVSQIKINVTNAYAGSLAWSNFFSRLTHNHPGRVVWLVFNVAISLLLMELGVFETLEAVLGLYSNVAIAWVGALVADLVVNKPLGWSPSYIEFKRAHLYNINPVGFGATLALVV